MKPELFLETNYEVQSCASDSSPASSCPSMIAFSEVSSLEEDECLVSAKQLLEYTIATSKRLSQFKLSTLLGYGSFGVVISAFHPYYDDPVAIKIVQASSDQSLSYDPTTKKMMPTEFRFLKHLNHKNILKYLDSWKEGDYYFLVTEMGGHNWNSYNYSHSLLDSFHLKKNAELLSFKNCLGNTQTLVVGDNANNRCCSFLIYLLVSGWLRSMGGFQGKHNIVQESIQKRIFFQLVEALSQLHSKGISHNDIKDENFLLDEDYNIKLIDFGHAEFYRTTVKKNNYGTPLFAPPEVEAGCYYEGPQGDIYALGLMLYEMNYGDLPENIQDAQYIKGAGKQHVVFDMEYKDGFHNPLIVDLCKWMLSPDPKLRPTIRQVASHPWFLH